MLGVWRGAAVARRAGAGLLRKWGVRLGASVLNRVTLVPLPVQAFGTHRGCGAFDVPPP